MKIKMSILLLLAINATSNLFCGQFGGMSFGFYARQPNVTGSQEAQRAQLHMQSIRQQLGGISITSKNSAEVVHKLINSVRQVPEVRHELDTKLSRIVTAVEGALRKPGPLSLVAINDLELTLGDLSPEWNDILRADLDNLKKSLITTLCRINKNQFHYGNSNGNERAWLGRQVCAYMFRYYGHEARNVLLGMASHGADYLSSALAEMREGAGVQGLVDTVVSSVTQATKSYESIVRHRDFYRAAQFYKLYKQGRGGLADLQADFSNPRERQLIDDLRKSFPQKSLHDAAATSSSVPSVSSHIQVPLEAQASTAQSENVAGVSISQSCDLITTTAAPTYNKGRVVDARIEDALLELQAKYPHEFSAYMNAVGTMLYDMKEQGLLSEPLHRAQEIRRAIAYGIQRYFHYLKPTNPMKHPREFMINAAKYAGWCVFNMIAGNKVEQMHKAIMVVSQICELSKIDTSNMTTEQYADMIAERAADITYMIISDQVAKKVSPGIDVANVPVPRPSAVVETAEGGTIKVIAEIEDASILKNGAESGVVGNGGLKNVVIPVSDAMLKQEHEQLVLQIQPLLDRLTKDGAKIREIHGLAFRPGHIFSEAHLKKGIMSLGDTKYDIIAKVIDIIGRADRRGILRQGTTRLWTEINGHQVEVHIHIEGDKLISFNTFRGYSNRPNPAPIRYMHE